MGGAASSAVRRRGGVTTRRAQRDEVDEVALRLRHGLREERDQLIEETRARREETTARGAAQRVHCQQEVASPGEAGAVYIEEPEPPNVPVRSILFCFQHFQSDTFTLQDYHDL